MITGKGNAFLITLFLTALICTSHSLKANPLLEHRWDNRLLIIFAKDRSDPNARSIRERLGESSCELADRELIIGWFLEKSQSSLGEREIDYQESATIRSRLKIKSGDFSVVLVGKDGGLKAYYEEAPNLQAVFALIDDMPMRQAEQRGRGFACGGEQF